MQQQETQENGQMKKQKQRQQAKQSHAHMQPHQHSKMNYDENATQLSEGIQD